MLAGSSNCILMTEFWPYGLSRCGADGLEYLEMLRDLGFRLYELSGSRGLLAPVNGPRALVERLQARSYANLVGLRGNLIRSEENRSMASTHPRSAPR